MTRQLTLTKETPEQAEKRRRIWRHNSFIGHATMMARNAGNMLDSDSLTDSAREVAETIQKLSEILAQELRTRYDLPQPAS